ncbi:hypothetical protein ACWC5G_37390, partial [Streptomyces sp. NPDC001274]
MSQPYYLRGSAMNVRMNGLIGWLARRGLSLFGSAELSVPGRRSGQMQRIPVNPHTYEGARYLVSARGHSQWVRNMRAAGVGRDGGAEDRDAGRRRGDLAAPRRAPGRRGA